MKKKVLAALLVVVMLLPLLPTTTVQAAGKKKEWKGKEVKELQEHMTLLGFFSGDTEPSFGEKTKDAVMKMQEALHVPSDGIVTDDQWKLLKETVKDVQHYLKEKYKHKGPGPGVIHKKELQKVLKQWQEENGYEQDGILTVEMMRKMLEDTDVKGKCNALKEWVARADGTYQEKEKTKKTPKATEAPKVTEVPKATEVPKVTQMPEPIVTPSAAPTQKPVATEQITVQEKLDYLLEKLGAEDGGAYFTVNRKACCSVRKSGHGCTNCNVADIAQTSWFKELFGSVDVSNFPSHDVNSERRADNGKSCFGFACFAQWYLYADSAEENVVGKRVATIRFNETNIKKYVMPGDVIRVNGHSVVVYSIEEDGIWVVDSNGNTGGQLNCVVQKRFLKYTKSNMSGYTAYVNRPTKASELDDGMAGKFDMK